MVQTYEQNPPTVNKAAPSCIPLSISPCGDFPCRSLAEEAKALKTIVSGDISIKEEPVEGEAEGSEVEIINVEGEEE